MHRLARFTTRFPKIVLAVIIIITLIFGYFATKVKMTTDIKDFFPKDDPKVATYNQVEDIFGGAEYIMVAVTADDIFYYETLKKIDSLTEQFSELEGIASVKSLTSIDEIKGTEWGLEISSLISELPENEEELRPLKGKILGDEMYRGFIVSEDAKAALIILELDADVDSVLLAGKVSKLIEDNEGPENLYITGTPVLNNVLADSMKGDLKKLLPIVLLIIALILYLYFRSLKGVILPFTTVLISLIWTLGLMGILDKSISPLNAVMPIILVSLGNAYGIYLLNRYEEELKFGKSSKEAVIGSITTVGIAILMAGGTTVAGFASNVFSDITLMRDFGIFTSFGVAIALLITLTLFPAVLSLIKSNKKKGRIKNNYLGKITSMLVNLAINKSKIIIIITLFLVILSLAGLPRLKTDSNFFNFFAEDSQAKIAYNLVKDKFTGSESIEIFIEGDVQDPELLKAMNNFQNDLKSTGLIGEPTSIVNIIERTNKAMHENQSGFEKIPDNRDLIAQYLLLIEMSDDSYLQNFVTLDYQKARIQALVKDTSSEGTASLLAAIERYEEENFAGMKIKSTDTGIIVLIDALADMIIKGQIKGLIFALITVFIIVFLLLHSLKGSILSVLLIALVSLINFGVMGWAGIALDIVTVLISSIGVGVGIDYSIHIYSRYLEEFKAGLSVREAIVKSIETTGKSIISNAAAVISGFIILVFSSFPPFKYFGILVSLIMFVAATGAMLFIPAMLLSLEKYNLKSIKKGEK